MKVWDGTKWIESKTNYTQNKVNKTSSKKKNNKTSGILKKSSAFDDGYDFGDVTKSTVSTIADLGTNVVKGIFNFGENIGDAIQYGAAGVSDFVGADKLADQIRENAKMDVTSYWFNPVQEKIDKNSILGDTTDNLATGVGNVIGMAGTGGVLGKASNVKMGAFSMPTTSIVSGLGSGMTEAYNNGATDGEAFAYGLGSGLVEGFSESLFSGLGNKFTKVFGPGALDDAVINKLTSKISNQTLKTLTQSGLKAAGEGVEEVVSGLGSSVMKKLTYLDDKDFFKIVKDENLFDQFVQGTVLSAIMQTPGTVNAVANGQDYVVPEQIENNVQNNQELVENLPQNGEVNTNTLPAQKNTKNSAKFEFMETNNPKINRFNNSAAMYYENNKKNRDMFNSIRKIINDKGYNVLFDDSIVNQNGNSVNAQIRTLENGEVEIRINPNSERAGEFLLMHEVTHAIETDSMKNLILDFASKNAEFNQALESLKQTYGTDDVSSEVVADISGQLLGNQEFINSLSLEQPSLFKQIYNKIIELANKLTGNSNQALFMKDLKNKWETAYRNSNNQDAVNNLNSETKFAMKDNKKYGSYWEVETKKDIFSGINSKRGLQQAALDYIIKGNKNFEVIKDVINGEEIQFRRISGQEYIYGTSNEKLSTSEYKQKMRIAPSIDDLINNAPIKYHSPLTHDNKNFPNGFNNYQGLVNIDDVLFRYIVRVGNTNKNDSVFYDVSLNFLDKIKGISHKVHQTDNSSSLINKKIPLTANNIPQSNENVKSDIPSINNSIQKVQKNTKNSENDITWQEHLEKNYESTGTRTDLDTMERVETQKDSTGRILTKEQQEYFKDSKIRDENGNLKVLYHGTPFGEFNTFKGKHFFFSEDYTFAHDYSDSKSFEQGLDGETKVIEAYLKAEKVFDASNPNDIQKLRENLSDKVRYWGNSWDKETLLKKLQRKDTLPPKWKSEQIEGKKFGDYIGDDRHGYNTDMFVGINDKNEIVYIPQERGLQKLTDMEKSELEKKLINGEEATYTTYETIFGELTERQIQEKINELRQYGENYKKETGYDNKRIEEEIKRVESELKWELGKRVHKLTPKTATQENTELDDVDNWTYFETAFDEETRKDIVDIIKDLGYDAINIYEEGKSNYIVFNPNQIKKVTNEKPTSNPDIRYSLSETPTKDNQGRTLTKEQQEFFKDSKVRDSKGRLEVMYRGDSGDKTINIFDKNKSKKSNLYGTGFYFADENMAGIYGNVTPYYLNIQRPLYVNKDTHDITKEQFTNYIKEAIKNEDYSFENYGNLTTQELIDKIYDGRSDFKIINDTVATAIGDYRDAFEIFEKANGIKYDGIISNSQMVVFESNQIKNINNTKPTSNSDIRYSMQETKKDKTLNPLEISKLTKEDANTTPTLPSKKRNKQGDGNSKFFENILFRTDMLTDKSKITILSDEDVKFYDKVTNKSSLEKAMNRLEQDGRSEVDKWFNKKSEDASDVDVAEGWILLKQYQDKIAKTDNLIEKEEMNRSMVEVAKKMREIGTKSGQAVQAFNIMNRLTPEGMVYYAQSELDEAFEKMSKYKTKKWIDANKEKFALTPEETEFIMNTMQEVVKMKDGYDKRVKLAEIQKVMTDKIPPEAGEGMKAWMRISMLFNPKTQVRNVLGNAIVTPVNAVSDFVASKIDKAVSKKTGVRTTGTLNLKNYGKGVKEGLYQSYNDFKKGINTRNIEGNRFEISQGKSFNDNSKIGKRLNQVDSMLSFLLDAGDRGFYEGAFVNSLNNQMILNNVTEPTQDMIDIATQEALSRTWQDNNNYTKFVMQTRNGLNMIHLPGKKGYGLGDVLIPFAKTPANLTKAIVDYSPVGLVNALVEGKKLKNVLSNGQYDAKLQHKFVQDLGKAVAGTMLYVIGYALANAGVISGESDEDKDTRNFMKNALGTNSYSIKIGNKSFTYDWAQPIAAPLSIMANYTQKKKQNADASKLENLISSLDVAGNILLEQSFLESINTVLSNDDGVATGIQEAMLELPSRAVPTFFKQITDLVDGTQRQTFEYDKPLKTAVNKVMAKVPGLSNTLSASVDTMGREIQKYGGKNNLFNVFINPANVSTENISKSGQEIYRIYKETGDKTVMPRTVDYYINNKGEKIVLTNKQREEYQKISGQIIEENIEKLLNDSNYKKLSDKEKAEVISNIVNYSYNKAKQDVLGLEMSNQYNKVNEWLSQGKELYSYYSNKKANDYYLENPEKYAAITSVVDFEDYSKYLKEVNEIKEKYQGEQYSQYRKQAVLKYVNQLPYSKAEKMILYKLLGGYSIKDYQPVVYNYIGKLNITKQEKLAIINALYGTDYEY